MRKTQSLIATLGLAAATSTAAFADYPERALSMIVPFGAGGGTDMPMDTISASCRSAPPPHSRI